MQFTADVFLALRYLRPKRSRLFVSTITLLSVLGPILGVALLIIVISVMAGFDRDIRTRILGMQAHAQILPNVLLYGDSGAGIEDAEGVLSALDGIDVKASPVIEGPVLIQHRGRIEAKMVRGIVPETEALVTDILSTVRGKQNIARDECLVGEELAMELGLSIGDDLIVHSPAKLAQGVEWNEDGSIDSREMDTVYLPEEVRIAGVFSMGVYEYDANIVFLSIDQAADLFGLDWGSATSLHARVPDPFQMTGVTAELRQALPGYRVVTWQEANRQLFGALRVEKNLMFFLLFFIVIVAAFGIAGTLITVAVQKTREIGILKAVGMTSGMVARIFVLQGAIIGFLGTALGTGLGLLVIHYRNQMAEVLARIMGVEVFPKELYHLSQIPALVTPRDVVVIVVGAWLICVMASLMPAVYASLLSPAQALQEEN